MWLFSSIIVRHSGTCEVCWTGCVGLVTVHSSSRKQRVIFDLQLHFIFHFFWLFSVGLHNAASSLFVSVFEDAAVVFEQPLLESSLVQTDTSFIPSLLVTRTRAAALWLQMFLIIFMLLIWLDCLVWLQLLAWTSWLPGISANNPIK